MTLNELRRAKLLAAQEILEGTDDRTLTAAQKNRIAELRRDAEELKQLEQREAMAYQPSNTLDVDPSTLIPITDENGAGFHRNRMEANRATKAPRAEFRDMHGRPVYVLNPEHRLAQLDTNRRDDGVSVGGMIAAWLSPHRADLKHHRRALSESLNTAGAVLVADELSSTVLDLMRAQSVCIQAGAQTLPMASDTLTIARVATDPSFTMKAENTALDESDPTFDSIGLYAKKIGCIVRMSREVVEDSGNIATLVENTLAQALAVEIDRQALVGTGAAELTGLHLAAGLTEASIGAVTDYTEVNSALVKLLNVNQRPNAWILNPTMAMHYEGLKETVGGQYLTAPPTVAGLRRLVTSSLPATGYPGSNESGMFIGDFTQLLFGVRRAITVERTDQRYWAEDQIGLKVTTRLDTALARSNAVCYCSGAKIS